MKIFRASLEGFVVFMVLFMLMTIASALLGKSDLDFSFIFSSAIGVLWQILRSFEK